MSLFTLYTTYYRKALVSVEVSEKLWDSRFNMVLTKARKEFIPLHGVNLSHARLNNINFDNMNLKGANFSGATLNQVDFSKANLHDANFSGATLTNVYFQKALLANAAFIGAKAVDIDFTEAAIVNAVMIDCEFTNVHFTNTDIRNNLWTGTLLKNIIGVAIPPIVNLDSQILTVLENGGMLDMKNWHTCQTSHCRAGWAIVLAGQRGKELETTYSAADAGAFIYAVAYPNRPIPNFHVTEKEALADIRKGARKERLDS